MCFVKDRWTKFIPSNEYLALVKDITSVVKLHNFIQKFKRKEDKTDYWQTPEETLRLLTYDCDDSMRFCVDILKRVIGIEAQGAIQSGYDKSRWGDKIWNAKCHAVCVFPYLSELAVFSNKELYININSYEEAGYITFPDGLKYQEIRNWQGKVLKKKIKIFGVF